ncbi:hypothetical protein ACQJBY_059835 [Aegilops geniculata]
MRVGHPAAYPGAYLMTRAPLSLPGNPSPQIPSPSLISDDLDEAELAVVVIAVDPAATGLHLSRQDVEELRHHRLHRPRLSVGARPTCCLAIARSSPPRLPHLVDERDASGHPCAFQPCPRAPPL